MPKRSQPVRVYAFVAGLIERFTGFRIVSTMAEQVTFVMVPPLALIFLVLGTIFIGVATPTEGGAMGASGALVLAIMKGRLRWDLVRQARGVDGQAIRLSWCSSWSARACSRSRSTASTATAGSKNCSCHCRAGSSVSSSSSISSSSFSRSSSTFFEIAFIVIPLLGPAAEKLGIDLIWFGVMLGVNMQTSFMHPPFGFALFYLRSVAPREPYVDRTSGKRTEGVTTGQIYWGAVPFVLIQCIGVGLVIAFPAMVMHYKGIGSTIDPSKVRIEIEVPDLPPLDFTQPPAIK